MKCAKGAGSISLTFPRLLDNYSTYFPGRIECGPMNINEGSSVMPYIDATSSANGHETIVVKNFIKSKHYGVYI